MKQKRYYGHTARFLSLLLISYIMVNCSPQAKVANGSASGGGNDAKWLNSHVGLNGLKFAPHASVNGAEFSRQYGIKKEWWDKAFRFLKENDLVNIRPGSYVLDSGNVIASVSQVATKDMNQVNWEAHRNFNDLQYIITGKARMGVSPLGDPQAVVSVPYAQRSDTETFSAANGSYYDAAPGTFFIFSPKEIHRPAFKADGVDSVKKVVIKVRVPGAQM